MNRQQKIASDLVNGSILKLRESRALTEAFKRDKWQADKFIIMNLLDYLLTQVKPSTLAEYKALRGMI